MFNEFEKEQNQLLEKLVFDGIYPKLIREEKHAIIDGANQSSLMLELFITPTCDKNCTYCYLQQHSKELYPPEFNSPKIIKKNLRIFLNSFIERGYNHINRIDIFSGEIWAINYGYEILDIILEYMKAGLKIDNFIVPTNGSFLYSEEYTQKMRNYADAFLFYHCNFVLSFSYDGKILDIENRPFRNKDKNLITQDEMLKRLYDFHIDYHYGFHPMIYAENIDKQIDNFNWWTTFLSNEDVFEQIMFLEVRNDNWSDDNIISYLKWLKHIIEYQYKNLQDTEINFSMQEFLQLEFGVGELSKIKSYNYLPQRLVSNRTASCGLTQGFCVRLGDLGICPCHRTSYDKLMIGNFIVENNKITGIHAINPSMAINIWMNGDSSWLECDACALKKFCIKGCRGSQFETHREPMYPVDSACEHAYAKQLYLLVNYVTLIEKYNLEYLTSWKQEFLTILKNTEQQDPRRYDKWLKIIQSLMLNL